MLMAEREKDKVRLVWLSISNCVTLGPIKITIKGPKIKVSFLFFWK